MHIIENTSPLLWQYGITQGLTFFSNKHKNFYIFLFLDSLVPRERCDIQMPFSAKYSKLPTSYLQEYLNNITLGTRIEDLWLLATLPLFHPVQALIITLWFQLEDMFQLIVTPQGIEKVIQ